MTKLSKRKTIKRVLSSALAATLTFTSLGLGNFSWADDVADETVIVQGDDAEKELFSGDPSIIISTNVGEDEEKSSEISSELESEERSEEATSEEDSEKSSEKEKSEKTSEEDASEKSSKEDVLEETSEESSEELEKEDTKKSNIEVTFDEGVTVVVENDDTKVTLMRHENDVYVLNGDKGDDYDISTYDDKFIINDFDVDEDIDISFAANDTYVLTDYSITNDDEIVIEESEVEKFEYGTQLTATDNVYININTDIYEGDIDINTLDDTQKYIYENINSDYINKITKFLPADMILLKSTAADKHKLTNESFEGVFSSNEEHIAEAYLYQRTDAIGLYDLNKKSDYLVGKIDLLSSDDDFTLIDYVFTKSNANGEVIDGAIFDTSTGLVYLPKSLIGYLEDGSVDVGSNQLQILYAFDDGTDNIEVEEIENADGEITEIEVNTAAPKVFMRMAAPSLLAASSDVPEFDIPYGGIITGTIVKGDTMTIDLPYNYSTEKIGNMLPGWIKNTNVLADTSCSPEFVKQINAGTYNMNSSSLISNWSACFPHRIIISEPPETYTFDRTGATLTFNPGVYALECIHTQYGNAKEQSPMKITVTVLDFHINDEKTGYVYLGLTCPQIRNQSGAGIIKLAYQNDEYKEQYGKFKVVKEDTEGHRLGSGFVFEVRDENNNYKATLTTNGNGEATMSNIPIPMGVSSLTYHVREVAAPKDEWKVDENWHDVTITPDSNEEVIITFKDKKKFKISVVKVDTEGQNLERASMCQILDKNKQVVVGAFPCGYKEITVYVDKPGKYYLHESYVPEGYLPAKDVSFTIPENQDVEIPVKVEMKDPFDTVVIEKIDDDEWQYQRKVYLTGAHLYLYKKVGSGWVEIQDHVTNGSPWVLKHLAPGNYKIEEHQAPDGYVRKQDDLFFEVKDRREVDPVVAQTDTYQMTNSKTTLSILKIDAKTNKPLAGATLSLYHTKKVWKNGRYDYVKNEDKLIDTWTSDLNPHVIRGLKQSEVYWLEELTAPKGYIKFDHMLVEFGHQHTDECYSNETVAWPLVYASEAQTTGVDESWICSCCKEVIYSHNYTTDDYGTNWDTNPKEHDMLRFGELNTYYVNSKTKPTSYSKTQDAAHPYNVRDLFPSQIITVFKDKSLKNSSSQWISGLDPKYWHFNWSAESHSAGGFSGYTCEAGTDAAASYDINIDLTFNDFYHYKTSTGPHALRGFHFNCPGYNGHKVSWLPNDHVTSNGGELICGREETKGVYIVKVPNKRTERAFSVSKVDSRDGSYVSGATLAVYKLKKEGGEIEKQIGSNFKSGTEPKYFDNAEKGWYRLVEVKAPTGYLVAKPVEFEVDDNKNSYVDVKMVDQKTRVYIQKNLWTKRTGTGGGIGAQLQIIDPSDNNKVVDSWWTKGDRHEVTGLTLDHTYILHEAVEIHGTVKAGDIKFKVVEGRDANDKPFTKVMPVSSSYVSDNSDYKFNEDKGVITVYNYENKIEFIKLDADTKQPLERAHFELIRKSNNEVIDDWWSGQDGKQGGQIKPHVVRGLEKGTYIWREVKTPDGYSVTDGVDMEIEITNDRTDAHYDKDCTDRITFQYIRENKQNKAYFYKVDAKTGAKLEGAVLSLWKLDENGNPFKFVEEWETKKEAHIISGLPADNYILFELTAPTGYDYANSLVQDGKEIASLRFTLTDSSKAQAITVKDPRIKAEFELLKVNGSSGDPITDDTAEFEFLEYNATTGDYEVSEHYWIDYIEDGLYSVFNDLDDVDDHYLEWTPQNQGKFAYRETKAPNGSDLDSKLQYIDIKDDVADKNNNPVPSIILSNDPEHECPIHPKKEFDPTDPDTHKIFLGHNADESEYLIFTDPELSEIYSGKVFANEGYKGGFELVKWDKDATNSNRANTSQGDVTDLSGFEFKLYNRSGKAVYVYPKGDASEKVKVENNGLIKVYTCDSEGNIISTSATDTFITNSTGYIGIPHQSLSAGKYELIETKAAKGYQLPDNNSKSIVFTITKDDEYFHFEYGKLTNESDIKSDTKYFADDVIRGDVQLVKYDKELNKSEALGGKLEGVKFEIINNSKKPLYVSNKWCNKGAVVTTITAQWNEEKNAYIAETTGKLLPYGSYTIREKAAGEGYIKTDAIQNFVIRNNNEVVTVNTAGELLKFSNQVVRGDVQFKKVSNDTGRLIKAPFLITNVDTKEQHIVVTNSQGLYSSGAAKHSNKTNANDALLVKYKANPDYAPKVNELDDTAGIWFGQGEKGTIAPVDDELGALPYGDYVLQELRSHSNEGLDLVTINFSVGKSGETDNSPIDLDIIYDITSDNPSIVSSAVERTSLTHVAKAGTIATIVDKITVDDLVSEENYKAVGYLIDKKTGNKIKYEGKEVTDEYSFLADGRKAEFNMTFTFDTTNYVGNSVVVYLYLYKEGKLEDNPVTNQGADINNISETVNIPVIHTSLEDKFTKDNVVVIYETAEKSKVIDTVSYENLAINTANDTARTPEEIAENQTYTIKGKLYDKSTKKVVATSEITFTPTTTSGTVEVPYEFKGTNGHTYVATEELYVNNILVAEHNDLNDKAQTVYSPRGWTTAIDATTGTHAGIIGENQVIKDTVYYENLVVGKTYTIKGVLMDKKSNSPVVQKGAPVTATKVFTASKAKGSVELEFTVDTTLFKDRAIVVFEDFYHNDVNVYSHADINDENQTIVYSDLKTTAIDTNTTDNVAIAGKTTITDKVQCSSLIVGNTYTVKGTLMDKKTGEYLGKDLDLNPITASKEFTAEANNQTVDVVFTLDGSLLQGKTCVVFEDLYLGDELISTHEMLDDVEQTVYFPSVHTTAITDTGLKEQLANKDQLIYDKVELNNLVIGKEYTVTGKVYDKETEEAIVDNGDFVTSTLTFEAIDTHMVIELEFNISDAEKLNGKTMVVFEKLYHEGFVVAAHEDINDFEQSVKYPGVETNAFDIDTKLDEVPKGNITINDEVAYTNLEKDATYTIKGTIYRKDTNEPFKFADGYVLGTTTFIAKAAAAEVVEQNFVYVETLEELNAALASAAETTTELGETKSNEVVSGKVNVRFENIDVSSLYGETMVAFEYLYRDSVLIGVHTDIEDENQDIKALDISTFAREKASGIQEIICSEKTNIIDTITITNATEGNTYTITSKIVDIETNKAIATFKNDYTITNENYVETKDGYKVYNVDIDMTIDSTELGGKSFVIYEYIERDGVTLALHEDKDDLKQRLYFPVIGTTAKDSETKDFDSLAEKDDVLIDTVAYENLTKGELYYVVGTLMDKETGLPVVINNKEVTSTTYFIAGEDKPLDKVPDKTRTDYVNSGGKVNGTIDVTFKFESTSLAGKDVVVFEEAYTFDNIIIGRHKDINDKGQTISYPKVSTTLLDGNTKQHESLVNTNTVFIDTVKCENLRIGQEYTVTGTLVDSETGKPLELKGTTSSTTFTATEANCEVEVKFTFDSTSLAGKTVVCFEDFYRNGYKIAVHADINDENQSIKVYDEKDTPKTKYVKVKIAKVDKTKPDKMLAGAEITIFNADGTVAKDINGKECIGVTDKDGLVWFHLYQNSWDHYYAQETKAPKDYALCSEKFPIYATDEMSKDADNAYQINITVYDLPNRTQTGDTNNVLPFALGGLVLLAVAGASTFFILRKKKKEDDSSEE